MLSLELSLHYRTRSRMEILAEPARMASIGENRIGWVWQYKYIGFWVLSP